MGPADDPHAPGFPLGDLFRVDLGVGRATAGLIDGGLCVVE